MAVVFKWKSHADFTASRHAITVLGSHGASHTDCTCAMRITICSSAALVTYVLPDHVSPRLPAASQSPDLTADFTKPEGRRSDWYRRRRAGAGAREGRGRAMTRLHHHDSLAVTAGVRSRGSSDRAQHSAVWMIWVESRVGTGLYRI